MPPVIISKANLNHSNYKFSQDGGVSSSARTNRLNYNTITTNGGLYTTAYRFPGMEMHYLMENLVTLIQLKTKLVFLHLAILHAKQPK